MKQKILLMAGIFFGQIHAEEARPPSLAFDSLPLTLTNKTSVAIVTVCFSGGAAIFCDSATSGDACNSNKRSR